MAKKVSARTMAKDAAKRSPTGVGMWVGNRKTGAAMSVRTGEISNNNFVSGLDVNVKLTGADGVGRKYSRASKKKMRNKK